MTTLYTEFTGQLFTLYQELIASDTYDSIDFKMTETPLWASGIVKIDTGEQSEWVSISALSLVTGTTDIYRGTVTSRGLDKDATSPTDSSTSNQKNHNTGSICELVTHSYNWNNKLDAAADNTITGSNTVTNTFSFTSTTDASKLLQSVTTTQRDALTGTSAGSMVGNTTTGTGQYKDNSGSWNSLAQGNTNPNSSETTSGRVILGTIADQVAGTQNQAVVQTRYLIRTNSSSVLTADAGKITTLNADGVVPYIFRPQIISKWGGDGSNGNLSLSTTLSGSNNTYIIKNYLNIVGGSGLTLDITPTNCIVHIKVRGDCDLTGWTVNMAGKGMTGGTAGFANVSTAPANGTSGGVQLLTSYVPMGMYTTNTGGGGGTTSAGTAGTASVSFGLDSDFLQSARVIALSPGEGGSGGGGGYNKTVTGGSTILTGAGGAGGGCIFFEVAGNLTFSGTTVDVSGVNGGNGNAGSGDGTNGYHAGGGGGGGAGGIALFLYNGTLSGSPTSTTTAGTGGTAGDDTLRPNTGYGGGGGAGGSHVYTAGTSGTAGNTTTAGAGGNGATGKVIIARNTVFI